MAVQPVVYRFSVEQYHRMAEGKVFGEDARVELLDGQVVDMSPVGARHAACVNRLTRLLGALGQTAILAVQNPIELSGLSEPQPDIALLRPRHDFYAGHHPLPTDVLLVIEVADTSWEYDRNRKAPLYLAAGIPEVWAVDLAGGAIEVLRGTECGRLGADDTVAPLAYPDFVLKVADILG